jgi:hypothetical protein
MRLVIILIVLILAGTQCARKMYGDAPSCLIEKLNEIRSEPVGNPPAKLSEYEYNGKRVYLLIKPCCDQYNELYDSNCNYLCAPSGGLTGKGDGKCPDFEANAKFIKVVWEDKR